MYKDVNKVVLVIQTPYLRDVQLFYMEITYSIEAAEKFNFSISKIEFFVLLPTKYQLKEW